MFGGIGADVAALSSAPERSCDNPRPAGQDPFVDDFEDGDHRAFKVFAREGWWWAASDGTPGSTIAPDPARFRPALRDDVVPRRAPDGVLRAGANERAAHLVAGGQTRWGAQWGTPLRALGDGLKCPYNASAFAGLRLRAKGPATIALEIATPMTVPLAEEFGAREHHCWNHFAWEIELKPQWEEYFLEFAELRQSPSSEAVRFDPARVLGIQFSAPQRLLPVDFWIDDIAFVTAEELAPRRFAEPGPSLACHGPRCVSEHALLDDFEDGNHELVEVPGRVGEWWSGSDGTPGSILKPDPERFLPARRVEASPPAHSNGYAGHFTAHGQKEWGAAWGATLRGVEAGVKSPFNAESFAGLRFRAKGTGKVALQVAISSTMPRDVELGSCDDECGDHYTRILTLQPEWYEYVIGFSTLQQMEFSAGVRFDPRSITAIQFVAYPPFLPVDFWLDDLSFVTALELAQFREDP